MNRRFGLAVFVLHCGLLACGGRTSALTDAPPVQAGVGGAESRASSAGASAGGARAIMAAGGSSVAAGAPTFDAGAGGVGGVDGGCEPAAGGSIAGGSSSLQDFGSIAVREATRFASSEAWASQKVVGMSVGASGQVYVALADRIDQVMNAIVSPYLSAAEAAQDTGLASAAGFKALDVDERGAVYAVFASTLVRSQKAHHVAVWRDNPTVSVQLGVVGVDDLALVSMQSLWRVTPHCAHRGFTNGELLGLDCGAAQLAVAPSGTFLYSADCGVNQLYRGNSDGSTIGAIYSASTPAQGPMHAVAFKCIARDPFGGFFTVVDDGQAWQLYHLTEGAHDTAGVTEIEVTPPLARPAPTSDSTVAPGCRLAARSDGTVFLQSSADLWQLALKTLEE